MQLSDESVPVGSLVRTRCAADITPEPVEWLWPGWLAAGKMHILAGAPGTGKTTLAEAFAATLSTCGRWPDGTPAPRGSTLIWSGEDDPADTLVPRLMAMETDLRRVHFIDDVIDPEGPRPFDPARDFASLSEVAERIGGLKLIILDPIVSAVAADSHKNGEVRRALQPVVDLAARIGAAVIGITHFSKSTVGRDPLDRVTGSLAFGALARIVLATAKIENEDGSTGRILARAKSNIGLDHGGFEYDIETTETQPGLMASRILWGKPIDGAARDLLGVPDEPEERSALVEAKEWLEDYLLDKGTSEAKEVMRAAKSHGISDKTLRRARESLGIKPRKTGGDYGGKGAAWVWDPPALPQDAQDNRKMPELSALGHLVQSTARKPAPECGLDQDAHTPERLGILCKPGSVIQEVAL